MHGHHEYRFEVLFLEEAVQFLNSLAPKAREKVLENIRISRFKTDPKLLKKIDSEIWEFRTRHRTQQIRLLAFWDKQLGSLVVRTHGFIKKSQKLPSIQMNRAKRLKSNYFKNREL